MITKEKVDIYNKYKCDIDGWARVGTISEKKVMNDHDWYDILNLIQRLNLIKKGNVADIFINDTEVMIVSQVTDEETRNKLKVLSENLNY